jgi:hypothetical protein
VAGALNNDMIGWSGDGGRIDNTVRWSNAGLRDLQLGASILFSELVLYDARYFVGTDAQAFNNAWGDIVGGIGSYPILANPNYHEPTDTVDTIDARQVAETAKVTVASLMAMASSPSRPTGLIVSRRADGAEVRWAASPEADIAGYLVTFGAGANPQTRRLDAGTTRVALPSLAAGTDVAVKAVNQRGLASWDSARAVAR